MQALLILWQKFFTICLLRQGPQDLPVSSFLLQLSFISYAITAGLLYMDQLTWGLALIAGLTETIQLSLLTFMVLSVASYGARGMQTVTALLGTGSLFNLFAAPLIFWISNIPEGRSPGFPALLLLGCSLWSMVVYGHIFRTAFSSRHFGIGLGISFIILIIISATQDLLFPLK